MSRDINVFSFTGNLTRDPESSELDNGNKVCRLRVAVNNGKRGDREFPPTYIDVDVWNGQGENAQKYLAKGRGVAVQGKLNYREWTAEDGSKRSKHSVMADSVKFLGGAAGGEAAGGDAPVGAEDIPF